MKKRGFKKNVFLIIGVVVILLLGGSFYAVKASSFSKLSDTISTSRPSMPSNHLLRFRIHTAIPGGGRIEIRPDVGFTIPALLDYTDVDLATSSQMLGTYTNRSLAGNLAGEADRVLVTPGAGGLIEITINPSSGIDQGDYLEIKIGQNAGFEFAGDVQLLNPLSEGTYSFQTMTYDGSGNLLESGEPLVSIIESVAVYAAQPNRLRSNGKPQGSLLVGTTQTLMSLMTNGPTDCRYSDVAGTAYDSMTGFFAFTGGYYHSTLLSGLSSGQWYRYYIRCDWGSGYIDEDDYDIAFYVQPIEADGTGDGGGTGGGVGDDDGGGVGDNPGGGGSSGGNPGPSSGGGAGGGTGGGGGAGTGMNTTGQNLPADGTFLYEDQTPPFVSFVGYAYPSSEVNILKDGVSVRKITSGANASFKTTIGSLREGVYTFALWSNDSAGRKSITKTTTFWIKEGTKTTSKIFLPPTIVLQNNRVELGDNIQVFGESAPDAKLDVWFYSSEKDVIKKEPSAGKDGKWSLDLDTDELKVNGAYFVKSRAYLPAEGFSDFGNILPFGIGQDTGEINTCQRADINKDSKVSLFDFSILLYYWQSTKETADINLDGKVNLVDFSLMMYCWTG